MSSDPQSDRAAWDAFIDALDRAGQAGSAAAVEVPSIAGVITGPGESTLMRILRGFRSRIQLRANERMAAFVAE